MFKLTRSQCRRASADHPIGAVDLGYFDPVTAMAASAALGAGGQAYAANKQAEGVENAQNAEKRRLKKLSPYVTAGTEALGEFSGNIDGAPSYADVLAGLENDPGYQFELQQGSNAVQGTAAAKGLLRSGRTLKDLTQFAQGLATTRAGETYNRELGAFSNKQNQLLQLMQSGLSAGGATSSLPQLALAGADARASLGIGLANTGTNALSNLAFARMMQPTGSAVSPVSSVAGPTGPILNQASVSWGP